MTSIASRQAGIWRRLGVRFGLLPTSITGFEMGVGQIVIPTTNADDLLRTINIVSADQDISAAAAIVATVPVGKRWTLISVNKPITVSAAALIIRRVAGTTANRLVILPPATADTTVYGPWPMDQGNGLILGQGNAVDTAIHVSYMYLEEDAY